MARRVFVNAWVGVDNHGDELLFDRLLAHLRTTGETDVTVTSFAPDATRRLHRVDAIHPRNLAAVVWAIRNADLFVLGPGGLLQDASSPWNLPYQLHRAVLARLLRTPVLGMGLGADPMSRRMSGPLLRVALGRAEAIVVRDDTSRGALTDHRLAAVVTADLAFGSQPPPDEGGDAVVVSLRPRRRGGLLPVKWQRQSLDDEQIRAVAKALDKVSVDLAAPVRFIALEPHTDQPLHEAVAACMTRPASCVVPAEGGLIAEMATAHLVIATRYHAGITALIAGRPTVLIGYAPKVRSLATATGVPLLADTNEALADLPNAARTSFLTENADRTLAALQAAEARNGEIIARALGRDA